MSLKAQKNYGDTIEEAGWNAGYVNGQIIKNWTNFEHIKF